MILTPKAKPVRIRIASSGKDNSTLEELKQNFCIADVIPLIEDKRLCRWLLQIGENEFAEKIEGLSLSDNDIIKAEQVLCLFFKDVCKVHSIVDLIDCNNRLSTKLSDNLKEEITSLICNKGDKEIIKNAILRTYKSNRAISSLCENYSFLASGDEVYELHSMVDDSFSDIKGYLLELARNRGSLKAKTKKYRSSFLSNVVNDIRSECFDFHKYERISKTQWELNVLYMLNRINVKLLDQHFPISHDVSTLEKLENDHPFYEIWYYMIIIDGERNFTKIPNEKWALYENIVDKDTSKLIDSYRDQIWLWYISVSGIKKLVELYKKYPECYLLSETLNGKYNLLSNQDIYKNKVLDCLESIFDQYE